MYQEELLYSQSSVLITVVLFILIIVFNEFGFRIGRFVQHQSSDELMSLTGSVQASILGLLALLLGFTFSMSMQRFDNRSLALIDEANAIGTAIFRIELLHEQYQQPTNVLLKKYIDLRIAIGKTDLTRQQQRSDYNQQIAQLQRELWAIAIEAANTDPRPVTTGAFINSLNAVFDAQGKRNALLHMHVPEVVLFLLFIVFVASVGIIGYSSGLGGKRMAVPTVLVAFLISMIVFIIIDLDRPKRGLVQVNQAVMEELRLSGFN